MNVVDVVRKYARVSPNDPAFVEIGPVTGRREEVSWVQFDERTNRLANSLLSRGGVTKGEKVFCLSKNSIKWIETYFAILKTGAWAVPLNFRFTDDDIRFCARTAEPVAFLYEQDYATRIGGLRKELSTTSFYACLGAQADSGAYATEALIKEHSPSPPQVTLEDEAECALYFTSGTTGVPKPVLIQHKSVMSSAITEAMNHKHSHADRFLMMAPLYHVAIAHMLGVMAAGGCTVLLTEQVSPRFIVETMAKERISVVFLLVPWAIDLLEAFDAKTIKPEEYDLSSWRLTHMGAQPIPPSVVKRLKAYFPKMGYDTNYGLSETMGPGSIYLGMENERKVGAIGQVNVMWDARIVDEKGEDVAQGGVGEVVLKGPGVMKGYYKNPSLTANVIDYGIRCWYSIWCESGAKDYGACKSRSARQGAKGNQHRRY